MRQYALINAMKNTSRSIGSPLSILAAGFFLTLAVQAVAFSEPSSNPPAGEVSAPINTGSISQDKSDATGHAAWITADGLGSRYGALLATVSGNVGIGTTNPTAQLMVNSAGNQSQWAGYFSGSNYGVYGQANGASPSWGGEFIGGYGLYAQDTSGYYGEMGSGGYSFYGNGNGYFAGNVSVSGSISAGGTVIYSCPRYSGCSYDTCAGQHQLGSTCICGSTYNCTAVGHLVN
jgi:hypothetical protein